MNRRELGEVDDDALNDPLVLDAEEFDDDLEGLDDETLGADSAARAGGAPPESAAGAERTGGDTSTPRGPAPPSRKPPPTPAASRKRFLITQSCYSGRNARK